MGLSLPLDKFSFVFGERGGISLVIDPSLGDDSMRWQFCLLNHNGHRVALMIECANITNLKILESSLFGVR
jgi:hypothetical protein